MATKFVKDNGFDTALLDLVKEVFKLNNVKHDPTDYVPTKVSSSFKIPGLVRCNSVMHLSPLTSNMRLPNLRLFYDRKSIDEVLEPFDPYLNHVDINSPAHEMIDDINLSIGNQVVLRKEDFYDTYVGQNESHTYIDLHAKPDSYFYYGGCHIPVIDSDLFVLTFDINPFKSFYPTKLKLEAKMIRPFVPVGMKLETTIS